MASCADRSNVSWPQLFLTSTWLGTPSGVISVRMITVPSHPDSRATRGYRGLEEDTIIGFEIEDPTEFGVDAFNAGRAVGLVGGGSVCWTDGVLFNSKGILAGTSSRRGIAGDAEGLWSGR